MKTKKQLEKEINKEKKELNYIEFIKSIEGADMVELQPFPEGPQRELYVDLSPDLDLDSPYTIFLLFWSKEIWNILANNINIYALQ